MIYNPNAACSKSSKEIVIDDRHSRQCTQVWLHFCRAFARDRRGRRVTFRVPGDDGRPVAQPP